MKKLIKQLVAITAVVACASVASAVSLDTLEANNGTITIGDKVFADFDIEGFNPGDIDVTASIDASGVYHLTFGGSLVNFGGGAASDTRLFYTVSTLSGAPLISMIDQSFTLGSLGGGIIVIGETVRVGGFGGEAVAQSSVGFVYGVNDLNDPPIEVIDGDDLDVDPPQAKLWVTKDIFLDAASGAVVSATIIDQSFHQVPDGGLTVALLGFALMGVEGLRRRLSK